MLVCRTGGGGAGKARCGGSGGAAPFTFRSFGAERFATLTELSLCATIDMLFTELGEASWAFIENWSFSVDTLDAEP